jgi:hypothetical protein
MNEVRRLLEVLERWQEMCKHHDKGANAVEMLRGVVIVP